MWIESIQISSRLVVGRIRVECGLEPQLISTCNFRRPLIINLPSLISMPTPNIAAGLPIWCLLCAGGTLPEQGREIPVRPCAVSQSLAEQHGTAPVTQTQAGVHGGDVDGISGTPETDI